MPLALPHSVRTAIANRLRLPAWVVLIQLFIGLGWMRAATEKLIDPNWWSGAVIRSFVDDHADAAVGWYAPVATEVWVPFADSLAFVVVMLQLVAAGTLITGRHVGVGLAAGMTLNLHFVLAGAVDPSIFYLICQGALVLHQLERRRLAASGEVLEWLNVGSIILVAASVPMVRTVHPDEVIDDPAIVLATFGALFFVSTGLLLMRRAAAGVGRQDPTPVGHRSTGSVEPLGQVGAVGPFRRSSAEPSGRE